MTVSKTKYGNIITYTGTLAEVAQAMSDDHWPESKIHLAFNGGSFSGTTTVTIGWVKIL